MVFLTDRERKGLGETLIPRPRNEFLGGKEIALGTYIECGVYSSVIEGRRIIKFCSFGWQEE